MTDDKSQYGLGRLPSIPDERNDRFMAIAPKEAKNIPHKTHFSDQCFNQGSTPQCTSYAARGAMVAAPVRNFPNISFYDLYKLNQKYDRWPGENYEGSSVHGSCIALKSLGLISEYRWAKTVEQVADYVLSKAPMMLGTSWFDGFFEPKKDGFIYPEGGLAGGHAYLLIGWNRDVKCPDGSIGRGTILNSWGRGWGKKDRAGNSNGRAYISSGVLQMLLADQGEAAVVLEQKLN